MQNIKISELTIHPRNEEFFDDIEGNKWRDFKESIKRRGVVEAVVVTQDLMIVSGHQRVRACKELGMEEVPCRIVHYSDYDKEHNRTKEDMILEDLISTNIMQRGVGNVNPMKMAKCIMELERIKGIRQGSNNEKGNNRIGERENLADKISQSDLAEQLHISTRQMQDYKKLLNLIPELQEMINENEMKASVGYKVWAKMPKEEQEKFFNEIGRERIKNLTQKATQEYINKINNLENQLEVEKNKEPKVVKEYIDNTDYKSIEIANRRLKEVESEMMNVKRQKFSLESELQQYKADSEEYQRLQRDIQNLTETKTSLGKQIQGVKETTGLLYDVDKLLKIIAPIKYTQAIFDVKDDEVVIENLSTMVNLVRQWCDEMQSMLPNQERTYIEVQEVL